MSDGYKEGDILENEKGERIILRGGQWTPVSAKEGQVTMGGTGFEDYEPPEKMSLIERGGLAALSLPLLAGASPMAIPAMGVLGGLEGFAENADPKEAAIGATLGAGTAALPIGVRAGTKALVPRAAANPGLARLIGAGLGATGGGLLGAVGGHETGYGGYGALGGAMGGAFMGRHIGGDIASAAREAMGPEFAASRSAQAVLARRNARLAIPLSESPYAKVPLNKPISALEGGTPRATPFGTEPLVKLPEEWSAADTLQEITERLAREKGMQYAGGVRTGGPNLPRNRLFPLASPRKR